MRSPFIRALAVLLLGAGCTSDGSTSVPLNPAAALGDGSAVEPRIEARVVLPFSGVADGTVWFRVEITNRLGAPVFSGACADRVDVKPVTARQWIDATPAFAGCTRQLVSFATDAPGTLSGAADLATLRAVVGGAGGVALLRIRHVVWRGDDAVYVVQSGQQEIVVP